MKKGKNIFTIILTSILLIMSFSAISLYDNVNTKDINKFKDIEYYFSEEFQYTTLGLTMQLDSNYTPLLFSDSVNNENKEYVKDEFNHRLEDVKSFMHMDKDFFYIAKNTNTNKVITNIKNYDQNTFNIDNYGYTIHVNYDKEGYCTTDGNVSNVFSKIETNDLFDSSEYRYEKPTFSDNDISVNTPKNIDIQYIFSKNIKSFEGLSGYLNSWEHYNAFSAVVFCVFSLIIFLFILFYPIKYVEQTHPFKTIKKCSFEINLFAWPTILTLAFLAILMLAGTTINGQLNFILNSFGIGYGNQLLFVINFIVWYLSLLSIAISIFLIKFIVVYGPIHYFKDYTLISRILSYIKRKLNILSEIDLTSPMHTTIMKYVLINGAITIFIALWNPALSIVFTIIYTLLLFFYIKMKTQEIQTD